MPDETEKSKRKEKPKGEPRRNRLVISIVSLLIAIGVAAFFGLTLWTCACSYSNNEAFEHTSTSIKLTNVHVALLLTETQVTSLNLTVDGSPEALTASVNAGKLADTRSTAIAIASQAAIIKETALAREAPITMTAAAMKTSDATSTPSPAAGITATMVCFFTWASQDDAEAAQPLIAALDEAQIAYEYVRVTGKGENSNCTENGSTSVRFLLMNRTPMIGITDMRTDTPASRGAAIEAILLAIEPVTIDKPYELQIIFESTGTESVRWSMPYAAAFEAWNSGTTGAALFEAGRGG